MGFISLTHLQTALNKIKTIFDTKAELTDIPDKLPADGGNADTVNGHTVNANVPADAVFTDTKVTSVANHYTPSADSNASLSASASGATAAWDIDVVKGVTLSRDAKGHVTGVSVTSGKIPANPNTDTKVTNTLAKTTKAYVTGTTSSSTNTGTQVFDTGVYLDTTAGQIVATTFKGALSGNASTATALTSSAGNSGKPIYFSKGKPVVCSTIITVRAGALPTTGSSSSSIKLSYLSNYSKATIFVYMNQSFDSAGAERANRIIDTITITGISSSMTAASYDLSGGSSTGCTVSISSAGVITLTVPIGKSYKQNYVVFYYN